MLDIGCGTGTFACLLSGHGVSVTGLDPAQASLDVARSKCTGVAWVLGGVEALPPLQVDLVTMTANVAQVFIDDADWHSALLAARRSLRPGGHLAFESRDPARKAWLEWTRERTHRRVTVDGEGSIETWTDLLESGDQLVTFRTTFVFERDGAVLTSDSTLRFRERDDLNDSLELAGMRLVDVRDAPDRPGREFVFIATVTG